MRVKPWPILFIALIHILAPLTNFVWSARISHVPLYDYFEFLIFNKRIYENLFWFILPIMAGFSILKFRKWSYFFILIFSFSFSIILGLEFLRSPKLPLLTFLFSESINIFVLGYFLHPAVRNIYLNKNLRWWEQKPRYLIDHPVQIQFKNKTHEGMIRNISEGGCFIEASAPIEKMDRFILSFEVFQRKFHTESQAVYASPRGIGTFFLKVHPSHNELSKLIDQLSIHGYPLRSPKPHWKDSLKDWLKKLLKGEGLIPRAELPPNAGSEQKTIEK